MNKNKRVIDSQIAKPIEVHEEIDLFLTVAEMAEIKIRQKTASTVHSQLYQVEIEGSFDRTKASYCISLWFTHLIVCLSGLRILSYLSVVYASYRISLWFTHLIVSLSGLRILLYVSLVYASYCISLWFTHLIVSLSGLRILSYISGLRILLYLSGLRILSYLSGLRILSYLSGLRILLYLSLIYASFAENNRK